jgi:hypothetical protein
VQTSRLRDVSVDMATTVRRITIYTVVWVTIIATILLVRFLAFSGTPRDKRLPLAITYIVLLMLFLGITSIYERRRLILRSGRRGRGTFGYLRGWIRTTGTEFALDTPNGDSPAERELSLFNRFMTYLFTSMLVVVPLLMF